MVAGAQRAVLALAVVLGLVIPARDAAAGTGRITVGRSVMVAAKAIRLADVAVLEGSAREFAELDLGPAPEAGATRRLEGTTILRRLHAAGLDPEAVRYEIPANVRVERAAQEISPDELRNAVLNVAPAALAPGEAIRSLDVPGAVRIPTGEYEARVSTAPGSGRARRRFDVALVQDGTTVATVPVRAEVTSSGPVVTVRGPVARGAVLQSEDLIVEERDRSAGSGAVVTDPAQAIGKEARVALAPGTALTAQVLASPTLVRRGDVVAVVVETAGMRLTVPGEALEAGGAGATVRIVNRTSRQELSGTVVDRGLVRVQH